MTHKNPDDRRAYWKARQRQRRKDPAYRALEVEKRAAVRRAALSGTYPPQVAAEVERIRQEDRELFSLIEAGRQRIAEAVRARNLLRRIRRLHRGELEADADMVAGGFAQFVKCANCDGKGYVVLDSETGRPFRVDGQPA